MPDISRLLLLPGLASRDLWHDRMVSLCVIASLVAVIAPLLLLFGLKNGVVTQLRDELASDPRNLEIRLLGNGNFEQEWFDRLLSRPEIGFSVPLTRSLNTQGDLFRDSQHFVSSAEIIPTANGDPLLVDGAAPTGPDSVVLTAQAASRLNATVGDAIQLFINRKLDGQMEQGRHQVTVAGILPESRFSRPAALVSLDLLVAAEDFRDGYRVELFGVETGSERPVRERFARARIYAKNLDAVAPLNKWLNDQHLETVTQMKEIESVKAISFVLGLIFSVIAWTSLLGCVASLMGAFLANIDRKRKDMAVLRLLGFQKGAVVGYVSLQALLITVFAFLTASLLYLGGSTILNQVLGAQLAASQFVCRLEPLHVLLAFICALLLAVLVAAIGSIRATRIQPAESLRDI